MIVERKGEAVVIPVIRFGQDLFSVGDFVKITYYDETNDTCSVYIGRLDDVSIDDLYIKLDMSYDYHSQVIRLHRMKIYNCERFDPDNDDLIN